MGVAYNSKIVTDGLQLCLDAGNIKSYPSPFTGTTWTDLSGNGNTGTLNGTINGGVGYSGLNGGSLTFDGTDDYVALGTPSALQFSSGAFTIDMWWRASSRKLHTLFSYGDNAWMYYLEPFGGGDMYIRMARSKVQNDGSIARVSPNIWYHTVAVCPIGSNNLHYINGALVHTAAVLGAFSYSKTLNIGYADNEGYYFGGNIGSAKIYNRALTATEVAQNYNALKGRYGLS